MAFMILAACRASDALRTQNNSLSYKPVFHEDWEHLALQLSFFLRLTG